MRVYRGLEELPVIESSVITIGSFDGVHNGHKKILSRIKDLSAELGVENFVITFHPHPRSVIYPKDNSLELLNSLQEKIDLFEKNGIDNLVIVPFTVEFSQIPALEYIEKFLVNKFHPKYIVIGYDHRFGLNRSGDINMLKQVKASYGFDIIEIEAQEIDEITISSTKIRKAIKAGDLSLANSLLGRPYSIAGRVIRGRKLGTEIGFPTANLAVEDKHKLIPMDGIYACLVNVAGKSYEAMLYIGDIPTIGTDNKKSIEVNIFDFNDDIYGERISLDVLQFLRHEMKFDGIESLKQQLHRDRESAISFFENYFDTPFVRASIAILNFNTKHLLEDFLPSISYSGENDYEIVLIDNASTDKSVSYVSQWFPEIKIIQFSQNYGYAEAYNKAIRQLTSEYVVLLNSDVQVEENWLDPVITFLDDHPDYAAAMPKVLSFEDKTSFEYAGASGGYIDFLGYPFCRGRILNHIEQDEGQYNDQESIFWASGAALVVRRQLFIDIGGFDKNYFAHHEEIDLCWRLHNAGYKIAVVPESVVYHLGGGTLDYANSRKVFLNFRNSLYSIVKNDKAFHLLWKIPTRLLLDGAAALMFLFKGEFQSILSVLKAHFHFYGHLLALTRQRALIRKNIAAVSIAPPNKDGWYRQSIVFKYYVLGKKTFSSLSIK